MIDRQYKKFIHNIDQYLLVALVFLLPFERIPSLDVLGVTLRLSFFAAGLVIVRAVWTLYNKRAKLPKLGMTRAALLTFLLWVAITGFAAINYSRAIEVVVFTCFTTVTALAISVIYKKEYLNSVISSLLVSATVVALFGIYQYIGNLAGLPNWVTGLRDRYSWQVFGFPRIQSVALEPLYYSSYLLLPLSVVVTRILLKQREYTNFVLAALFMTSIFLTLSRGGILALIGMVTFMVGYTAWLRRTNLRRVAVIIGLLVLSYVVSLVTITYLAKPPVNKVVTGGKKGSAAYTKQLQTTGLEGGGDERAIVRRQAMMILNKDKLRYVFGIGAGQFGPYIQGRNASSGGWFIVNNEPIEMLLELGIIGAGIFLVFIASLALNTTKFIRINTDASSIMAFALLGYLFAEAIQYQTFSTLYIMHIWVAIGLMLAVTLMKGERI